MSYTWSKFKAEVKQMLAEDGDRRGAETFIDMHIRAAVLDLQRYIPRYQRNQESTYYRLNVQNEGKCSWIAVPDGAKITEAFVQKHTVGDPLTGTVNAEQAAVTGTDTLFTTELQAGDLVVLESGTDLSSGNFGYVQWIYSATSLNLSQALGDSGSLCVVTTEKYPCEKFDWEDRESLISGQKCLNDNVPSISISPYADKLYIYPNILDDSDNGVQMSFLLKWDGLKVNWADNDTTQFDQATVMVVADWVKGECARHFEQDLNMWLTFKAEPKPGASEGGTYYQGRKRLYLDDLRRK